MLMVSCLVAFLRACACNVLLFSIWVFSDDETVTLPRKSSLLKNLPNEYYTTLLPSHPEKEDTIEKKVLFKLISKATLNIKYFVTIKLQIAAPYVMLSTRFDEAWRRYWYNLSIFRIMSCENDSNM